MSQGINSPSPPNAVADIGKASPSSNASPKQLPVKRTIDIQPLPCAGRCEPDGGKALDRPVTPLKTPQGWEPELSDLDFDFTASPGADEWQIGETADGCAMYSTINVSGAGVTVELRKWDW
ncbi:hypothetical protein FRC00_006686 [Tulasnella sp. 408]|nr:hypothetical protein FRC00_006686 [Tulasnella sp. 408]